VKFFAGRVTNENYFDIGHGNQIATSNVVSQVAANLYYYFWMISVELISKSTQEKLYEMNSHFNFYELKHI
jgi:hypothetical protein